MFHPSTAVLAMSWWTHRTLVIAQTAKKLTANVWFDLSVANVTASEKILYPQGRIKGKCFGCRPYKQVWIHHWPLRRDRHLLAWNNTHQASNLVIILTAGLQISLKVRCQWGIAMGQMIWASPNRQKFPFTLSVDCSQLLYFLDANNERSHFVLSSSSLTATTIWENREVVNSLLCLVKQPTLSGLTWHPYLEYCSYCNTEWYIYWAKQDF